MTISQHNSGIKRAAIICAEGIGDGLLMMIANSNLKKEGYQVTVYHNQPNPLSSLFPSENIHSFPKTLGNWEPELAPYDLVLMENDHSSRAYHLFKLRREKKLKQLVVFFPTQSNELTAKDFLFNPKKAVATNLANGCQLLLKQQVSAKSNELPLPADKEHRAHKNRIVIHPTSNDPKRNWPRSKFLALAKRLKQKGFTISWVVSPNERSEWSFVEKLGYNLPKSKNLKEVADHIYESGYMIGNDSGIGHLASNLNIPTLTISGNPKRVRLWRPDWGTGLVVTLPFPLPNFKGIGMPIRQNHWQSFVSVQRVLKSFYQLVEDVEWKLR